MCGIAKLGYRTPQTSPTCHHRHRRRAAATDRILSAPLPAVAPRYNQASLRLAKGWITSSSATFDSREPPILVPHPARPQDSRSVWLKSRSRSSIHNIRMRGYCRLSGETSTSASHVTYPGLRPRLQPGHTKYPEKAFGSSPAHCILGNHVLICLIAVERSSNGLGSG